MKDIELLAPAGSMEGLKAAVSFGADAVYLGGQRHNARINAKNFDEEEIRQAIKYARLRGKKVYVTLNTLLFENELEGIIEYVNGLQEMGACAVILQDLGAAKIIGEECTIPMHASTQMGIHNLDGCNAIEKLGFERAILSREVPLKEIEYISKRSNMELETFVHGALCSCFSGQCLFSYLKGGRSGNRGECAQPCRLEYKGFGHPFSTKDLMALELLPRLIEAGVTSFKIEGRMKRPAYAGVVTGIYRKAIDLALAGKDMPVQKYKQELIKIYNRGGFTKGYYLDNKDIFASERPNHMGEKVGVVTAAKKNRLEIKADREINVYDGLSFGSVGMEISDLYEDGKRVEKGKGNLSFSCVLKGIKKGDTVYRTTDYAQIKTVEDKILHDDLEIPVEVECEIHENIRLKLKSMNKSAEVLSKEPVEAARTRNTTFEDVKKCMTKFGDTVFVPSKIRIDIDNGVFVPVKEMNLLRRKAVALLEKELISGNKREKITYLELKRHKDKGYNKVTIGMLEKRRTADCDLFLVYPKNIRDGAGSADGIVLPPVSFDEDLAETEKAVRTNDILVCNNVAQIERFKGKCRIWAGMGMNCTNSYCAQVLYNMGCEEIISSVEASVKGTLKIKDGFIPAMVFTACPKKAAVGCEKCKSESITGDGKKEFTCVKLKNTYSFLLSKYKSDFGQVEFI